MVDGTCGLKEALENWLSGAHKIVIAGIGNPIRMDDYVGVKIVQDLRGRVSDRVMLIECETVPESFTQEIVEFRPTHVLLIDAAVLGSKPGQCKLVSPEQLGGFSAFSTHMLPLRVFCEYIATTVKAKLALLLVEPAETEFGEGLSREVSSSSKALAEVLVRLLH